MLFWFQRQYAHTVMRALCVRRDIEQVPQRSRCLETLRGVHARPHKKHPAQKQTWVMGPRAKVKARMATAKARTTSRSERDTEQIPVAGTEQHLPAAPRHLLLSPRKGKKSTLRRRENGSTTNKGEEEEEKNNTNPRKGSSTSPKQIEKRKTSPIMF